MSCRWLAVLLASSPFLADCTAPESSGGDDRLADGAAAPADAPGIAPDAATGAIDATQGDGTRSDAAAVDASTFDAPADASTFDAPVDASTFDATVDASTFDAAVDAAAFDAGPCSGPDGALPTGDSIAVASRPDQPLIVLLVTDCAGDPAVPITLQITNTGTSAVTWTATASPGFAIPADAGTTLASGMATTLPISTLALASPPSAPGEVASGELTITASFADPTCPLPVTQVLRVPLQEDVDGCFAQYSPQPVDFGDVPLGVLQEATVPPASEICYFLVDGLSMLGDAADPDFFIVNGPNGEGWTIGFRPSTAGPHASTMTFVFGFGSTEPLCNPDSLVIPVRGNGI
jgi:hypothetical protein